MPKRDVKSSNKLSYQPRSPSQRELIESFIHNDITFAVGPAGTGKTYLAAMRAIELFENMEVNKVILTRPAVTSEEDLGALPGDLNEKLHPYLLPLLDAFTHHWQPGHIQLMQEQDQAEIAAVGHMRGRSFYNSIILVDEAQNLTYGQLKMVLTRFGEGCKMIITGDPTQVDLPRHKPSGFETWYNALDGVEGIGVVRLAKSDIQRHPIVKRIVDTAEDIEKDQE